MPVPECRELNRYVSNEKADPCGYLKEWMKWEVHACISDCRTVVACRSGLVLKNQGDVVVTIDRAA